MVENELTVVVLLEEPVRAIVVSIRIAVEEELLGVVELTGAGGDVVIASTTLAETEVVLTWVEVLAVAMTSLIVGGLNMVMEDEEDIALLLAVVVDEVEKPEMLVSEFMERLSAAVEVVDAAMLIVVLETELGRREITVVATSEETSDCGLFVTEVDANQAITSEEATGLSA